MPECRLTVSRTYQPRAPRSRFEPAREQVVPFLRLGGLWLEDAGFPIGSRVRVEVEAGRLVVTPASEVTP